MRLWLLAALLCSIPISVGCGYRAQVRGVTTPDYGIVATGDKVCIESSEKGVRSELAAAVGDKIARLLTEMGYTVTGSEDADFVLLYDYDNKALMNRVRIQPISGVRTGIHTTAVKGPFEQSLSLQLVEADAYRAGGEENHVWAGVALLENLPTQSPRFLDMLLVAGLRHFPDDTGEVVEIKMRRSDPQAQILRQAWYPVSEISQN